MRRSSWLVTLVTVPTLAAAPWPQRQAAPPSFKTTTELVLVDVSVLDREGAPVAGLQPTDFRITVDRQPRRVVSVQFLNEAIRETPFAPTSPGAPSVPRFATNQTAGGGRTGVIVVDELSLPLGSMGRAWMSIGRLLDSFGPSDRLALVALPGPRVVVDFTNDYARIAEMIKTIPCGRLALKKTQRAFNITDTEAHRIRKDGGYATRLGHALCGGALPQLMPQAGRRQFEDSVYAALSPQACRALLRAEAAEVSLGIAERVSRFSWALTELLRQLREIDGSKQVFVLSEGFVTEHPFDQLLRTVEAVEARATIHTVRMDPSMFDPDDWESIGPDREDLNAARTSLETLAGRTGGRAHEMYGSEETAFRRLATEVSASYIVAIETTEADRDGEPHEIEVQVDRDGTSVHARREFVVRAPATDEATRLSRALQSPVPASDLPVRLTAFNLADADPSAVLVLVAAEIDREQRGVRSTQVGVRLSDQQGRPLVSYTQHVDLPASGRDGALSFMAQAAVPPGRYTLRVAAIRDGRLGSAELPLQVHVQSLGPLMLGDLVLNAVPVGGARPAPSIDGRVSGPRLTCAMQVGGDAAALASATFALEIVSGDPGTVLVTVPARIEAVTPTTRVAEAIVDMRTLPPGDYTARLRVTVRGQMTAVITPFTVEAAPDAHRISAGWMRIPTQDARLSGVRGRG